MDKVEQRYRYEVEKDGEYEYIRSYRKGDVLPNGRIVGDSPYIQIKHLYCNSIYTVNASCFINQKHRCANCCKKYENSFAHHIEVELGEPLEKYWDFEKNTVNPYYVWKSSPKTKIWIKCQNEEVNKLNGLKKKDYHGSYEINCNNFKNGKRCRLCHPTGKNPTIHPYDSFGYRNFDKVMSWHPDNKVSPFRVGFGSDIKEYKFICEKCGYSFNVALNSITHFNRWCPVCSKSKGEQKISLFLRTLNIDYIQEKTFDSLEGLNNGNLRYDFYLPKHNLLIEYQGEQHERYIKGLHKTYSTFERQQEHDRRKRKYAKENGIKLLEIWYWDFDNIEEILLRNCVEGY